MPSINRSTYLTSIQRGTMPGGYDVQATGPGTRTLINFDTTRGLHRRYGKWPEDPHMRQQGCRPTGRTIGPPGYEQPEYHCPFPIVGQPAWAQPGIDWFSDKSVFGGVGNFIGATPLAVLAAVAITSGILWYVHENPGVF